MAAFIQHYYPNSPILAHTHTPMEASYYGRCRPVHQDQFGSLCFAQGHFYMWTWGIELPTLWSVTTHSNSWATAELDLTIKWWKVHKSNIGMICSKCTSNSYIWVCLTSGVRKCNFIWCALDVSVCLCRSFSWPCLDILWLLINDRRFAITVTNYESQNKDRFQMFLFVAKSTMASVNNL